LTEEIIIRIDVHTGQVYSKTLTKFAQICYIHTFEKGLQKASFYFVCPLLPTRQSLLATPTLTSLKKLQHTFINVLMFFTNAHKPIFFISFVNFYRFAKKKFATPTLTL